MISPIRLISTDFDGTLFAEFESPPVPEELQRLIAELQAQGAKWAINTGRDMSSLMETLGRANLTIEPDFLVLVEREIYLHEEAQYLGLESWNAACAREHKEVFERIRPDLPRLIDWIQQRFHPLIYDDAYSPLCLIARDIAEMDAIQAHLEGYCRSVPGLTVVRNDVYARFSHTGYNKGTALAHLSQRLGVNAKNVFAAGDHLNDLPMLSTRFAGMLAAPANAIGLVKVAVRAQSGYVSQGDCGTGVAEAIKFYLERARNGG